MSIWENIFFAFWFFLPGGLANMFPIFAAHTPGLKNLEYPLDFNLNFRGRQILGPHKTVRGLIVAVLIGIITAVIQKEIYWPIDANPVILGFLLGLGAILGDAVKSFFKRQVNVASGDSLLFFDQIDYIIGGILFSWLYLPLQPKIYLFIVVIYFGLHLVSSFVGYLLGLKQKAI